MTQIVAGRQRRGLLAIDVNGISPAKSSTLQESFGSGAAQIAIHSVVNGRRRIVSMIGGLKHVHAAITLCSFRVALAQGLACRLPS